MRFRADLLQVVGRNLVGIYLFGSVAFPRFEPWSGDIDFYVVLKRTLSNNQRKALAGVHRTIARRFRFGEKIDGYYIPISKAKKGSVPNGLVYGANGSLHLNGRDDSWALHREHMLKGACIVPYGPNPKTILPRPSWDEIERALRGEVRFARRTMRKYPFWAVLNFTRLMYSYGKRRVVVSKIQSSQWALKTLASRWRPLIRSALRFYFRKQSQRDVRLLKNNAKPFMNFAINQISRTEAHSRKDTM